MLSKIIEDALHHIPAGASDPRYRYVRWAMEMMGAADAIAPVAFNSDPPLHSDIMFAGAVAHITAERMKKPGADYSQMAHALREAAHHLELYGKPVVEAGGFRGFSAGGIG